MLIFKTTKSYGKQLASVCVLTNVHSTAKERKNGNICQPVYFLIIFRVLKYTANRCFQDHSLILFMINVSHHESRWCDEKYFVESGGL